MPVTGSGTAFNIVNSLFQSNHNFAMVTIASRPNIVNSLFQSNHNFVKHVRN